jgi:hypothetical protein
MGRIEVRDFDGDLQALSTMAREAWLEAHGEETWPDIYRPELTRHLFADVADSRLLMAAYDGARLVAFAANLPRRYRFKGQTYKGVLSCMLVARKGYQGAAAYLFVDGLRRNEAIGADLALMTMERNGRTWRAFDRHLKPRKRIQALTTIYPIFRAVDLHRFVEAEDLSWYEAAAVRLLGAHRPIAAPSVAGAVRPYRPSDLDHILALTGRYPDQDSLVRVFDAEPLARQLHTEGVTSTVVYERGGAVAGFVNFSAYPIVSSRGEHRYAWVDFLHWEGLSGRERKALLAGVWEASRGQGCVGILAWNTGYYAKGPLFRSHFIPYPRFAELDVWILNPHLSLEGVEAVVEQVL